MGWFDTQIKERRQQEQDKLAHAYWSLAAVIDKKTDKTFTEEYSDPGKNALMKICNFYHIESDFIKDDIPVERQLEILQNQIGLMYRNVTLKGAWWKDLDSPVLTRNRNQEMIAVLPDRLGRYYYETREGQKVRVDEKNAGEISREAICFYSPLPQKALTKKDVIRFLWKSVPQKEKWKLSLAGLAATLMGMILPFMTQLLFSQIIPTGQVMLVYSVGGLLAGTAISVFLFEAVRNMLLQGIQYKMEAALSAAVFGRVLNMPADFFRTYSSGELTERILCLNGICGVLCTNLLGTGMTALFSFVYIFQIFQIRKELILPSLLIFTVQLAVAALGMLGQTEFLQKRLYAGTKVQSMVVSLINGIQKIKVAGCEKRVFAKWAGKYRKEADAAYNPPLLYKMRNTLIPVITIFGTLYLYWICLNEGVQVPQYVAFHTAFGMVSGAILALTTSLTSLSTIGPVFELAKPILDAVPQTGALNEMVHNISGNVEFHHVSFRYAEDGPLILDDLSLKIRQGQYVAIVGKTGCGKSTLMRLLLGFEQADTGAVYYDGKDILKLDQNSLHRQIGVVMQNGKLFSGSIYSNITVSAPQLTMDEAWEAARIAGIEEDIRNMPMGMHTVLSEGTGGISGGQKQRLMIARAVAPKPRLLLLDEATSALDNITQKQIADSLARMKCTRIVIAHRLSTIQACDRILVLDQGRIIEDGSYEELVSKNGFFAELVRRQQIPCEE